ncbi:MAG: hypothetical protein H0S78_08800 [Tissierellales bacterium]|nr:hypothetical protein [Tissierellales bacterium]
MKNKISKLYLALVFLFLYAPITVLVVYSFNDSKSRGNWGGFTFKWYLELFKDRDIKTALYYTVTIAILAAVISTIVGTVSAIGIYNMKTSRMNFLLNINYLPIINPDIVTGIISPLKIKKYDKLR